MLAHLRIRGLGVIEDAELPLSPGLTVISGETGAGKTMVVTGLGLLLGGRADAAAVRPGTAAAVIEGRVTLPAGSPVLARAEDAGAELDEGALLLARTVSAEGRSRAHVGGRAVPLGVLAELADDLVAVHGQGDQRRLLQPSRQRAALDRYAGPPVIGPLADYAAAFARLGTVRRTTAELRARARERAREADVLRFGIAEIEAVGPVAGEEADLVAEASRLAHADALRAAAMGAHAALVGDLDAPGADAPDVAGLVAGARRGLDRVRDHDPALGELSDRLAEVSYLLSDIAGDLASYAATVDSDPDRLAAVHERRAALGPLLRKYGDSAAEVLDWAARAAERLVELEGDEERIAALATEEDRLLDRLARLAGRISVARADAAARLARAVTAELAQLAMAHGRVTVDLRQAEHPDGLAVDVRAAGGGSPRRLAFGPTGVDEVELLLAAHPGAPPRPLASGASGGELSRVMLAVEAVFAGADPVPTFVFDEVDAGVGGRAAVEVGRRLARLAASAQVIVVTHLPQVAAFADSHLRVVKSDDGAVTRTGVLALDHAARVRELSRMLAGLEGSGTALAHAEELLEAARAARG